MRFCLILGLLDSGTCLASHALERLGIFGENLGYVSEYFSEYLGVETGLASVATVTNGLAQVTDFFVVEPVLADFVNDLAIDSVSALFCLVIGFDLGRCACVDWNLWKISTGSCLEELENRRFLDRS